MTRFTDKFTSFYKRLLPSPFSIAILLTLLTFILALIFTRPTGEGIGSYSVDLLKSWEEGLWKTGGGGLYFAFQMMLMLVLGHILAISSPASKVIDALTLPCKDTASSAFVVTIATIAVSLFNWGLGLIFGAILARKIGEKFNRENKPLNYALIGAAAYSGLMVWHGGLSGSAPIKAADENNLHDLVAKMDVDLASVPTRIDMGETVFSTMNIVVSLVLIIVLPLLMRAIGKKEKPHQKLPSPVMVEEEVIEKHKGAEKLDHSRIFSLTIGIVILFYAFHKAVIQPEKLSLSFLTPNFINFVLLGLGLMLHLSITKYVKAANDAISGATGILLQFPLYFGILGIMIGSGLIIDISDWFVSISTKETFSIFTFFSAGLVNVFVPSGGGQWVVQGPVIISAAQELGVSYPKAIMALSYGDQLTNMIQPFWALPLLGITGLKARDILPYTLILFLAGIVIFLSGLIIF
ncbi:MAG: short-chain fatty acid transporter [Crocinitomicaceae bacterium]|nr:short-chain fatty acid transporter [Crocinitomicaceae bacterium]